jgi:hypothetical protein
LLIVEAPGVAALLELVDDMIGDSKALMLSHLLLQSAHDLARATERESDGVSEHLPAGHGLCEHIENEAQATKSCARARNAINGAQVAAGRGELCAGVSLSKRPGLNSSRYIA